MSPKPIITEPLTIASIKLSPRGPVTEFKVAQIPMSMVYMHSRVVNGEADRYFGHKIRLVVLTPTKADQDRWPTMFKNSKKLIMVYGKRSMSDGE